MARQEHAEHRRPPRLRRSRRRCMKFLHEFLLPRSNPMIIHVAYFVSISILGFIALNSSKPKVPSAKPKAVDLFFTAVSAATVSSMSTVEMEVFSNAQLIVLTILMLTGGEVFTSFVGLLFEKSRMGRRATSRARIESVGFDAAELDRRVELQPSSSSDVIESGRADDANVERKETVYDAVRYLSYVVLGYFLVIHVGGSVAIAACIYLTTGARSLLRERGIEIPTFAVFTTVSSFANCGFVPTNENMMVFKKNTALLLLIVPQALLGSSMFPFGLRFSIWAANKITRRGELEYLMKKNGGGGETGYCHLLPRRRTLMLVITVVVLLVVQFVMICAMEWNSQALEGLDSYQKVVNSMFLAVNSRHTGESTVDLSVLAAAVLVVFVVMMYLPPYTTFMPFKDDDDDGEPNRRDYAEEKNNMDLIKSLNLSQLSYIAVFVTLICITEREKLQEDPLNFSVLNIVIEVVSAYGNVGFSTGYSCDRRLKPEKPCKDAWYGFSGAWSNAGKLILIFVMFFGRLKKFSMGGGSAWKLS